MTDAAGDGLAERGAAIFAQLRSTLTDHESQDPDSPDETPTSARPGEEQAASPTADVPAVGDPVDERDTEQAPSVAAASDDEPIVIVDTDENGEAPEVVATDPAPADFTATSVPPPSSAPATPVSPSATGAAPGTVDADAEVDAELDVTASPVPVEARAPVSEPIAPRPLPTDLPTVSRETSAEDGEAAVAVDDDGDGALDGEVDASAAPARLPDPRRFARPLPRVIAIANQKGGVGKTTTSVNLSACLADLGLRVLVVDLDPQGNATTGLGVNPRNLQYSMYEVLLQDRPLEDCIEPTSVRNLFVAPSSLDLAGAEIELVPVFSRELKLRRAIESVLDDYDYVLIDCPPSLGLLTVNGLAAAAEIIVPIQCEYYALEGLGQLLRNVNLVQQSLNPRLELLAVVMVMYDARTRLSGEVVREVRTHFGDQVARTVVPRTVRLSEAPSFGQPIIAFDPTSRGAIAYRELAKEIHGGQT